MNDDLDSRSRFASNSDPTRDDFLPDLSAETNPSLPTPAPEPSATPSTNPLIPDHDDAAQESYGAPRFSDTMSSESPPKSTFAPPAMTQMKYKKPRRPNKLALWFRGLSKKQKTAAIAVTVLFIAGILAGAYFMFFRTEETPQLPKPTSKTTPQPTTAPSLLTGRQVQPEDAKKQVIGVMIENSMEARPQSGLQEAGVVFEAIAEGGITRFLALYQDTAPESIGPIRSVRPYYLSWAMGFDAALAHVGGSPEALQNIKSYNTKDLDQMTHTGAFDRIRERYAPHNVFTSFARLNEVASSKGYTSSNFTGFERIKKGAPAATPTARTINVNISTARYNSSYTYDAATNTYARSMNGAPHKDRLSGKQITPDVVIAMVMNYSIHPDGTHSVYNTVGSGQVFVFQNGTAQEGTWQKTSDDSNVVFRDGSGRNLSINPGQTWITAINNPTSVTYQP